MLCYHSILINGISKICDNKIDILKSVLINDPLFSKTTVFSGPH